MAFGKDMLNAGLTAMLLPGFLLVSSRLGGMPWDAWMQMMGCLEAESSNNMLRSVGGAVSWLFLAGLLVESKRRHREA